MAAALGHLGHFSGKRGFIPAQPAASRPKGELYSLRAGVSAACQLVGVYAVMALVLVFAASNSSQAQMYLCRDDAGATNFTNVPNGSDCTAIELKKQINLASLPSRSIASGGSGVASGGSDLTRYDWEIGRIGRLYNVDPPLIKAIIHAESYFDKQAVSRCGAQGLMQLMPGTALELQVADPFNPLENIDGGTRYFRSLLDSFNEDLILSLAAYNAGPGLVARTGGVPRIPETLHYINKVLKMYKVYKASW